MDKMCARVIVATENVMIVVLQNGIEHYWIL